MTADEIIIAKSFSNVTFLPGSFNKRLARSMQFIADKYPEQPITERQSEWIYRLLYTYRKQIPDVYNKYCTHKYCKKL